MPVLTADELDVKMGFDDLAEGGQRPGHGRRHRDGRHLRHGEGAASTSRTSTPHESCGQCTPCREGSHWLEKIYHRIDEGHGTPADVELLESCSGNIEGRTICALADAAVWPLRSILKKFRHEFEAQHRAPGAAVGGALAA